MSKNSFLRNLLWLVVLLFSCFDWRAEIAFAAEHSRLLTKDIFFFTDRASWERSPVGYDVASGQLVELKPNGEMIFLSCHFSRDSSAEPPAPLLNSGYSLQSGHWKTIPGRRNEIQLDFKLVSSDKTARAVVENNIDHHITRTMAVFVSKSDLNAATKLTFPDYKVLTVLTRIPAFSNQHSIESMLHQH